MWHIVATVMVLFNGLPMIDDPFAVGLQGRKFATQNECIEYTNSDQFRVKKQELVEMVLSSPSFATADNTSPDVDIEVKCIVVDDGSI